MPVGLLDDVREGRLHRANGRTVAWCEVGPQDGVPMLRLPGTPGCRYSTLRADRSAWEARGLRMILTERPGFGASGRLPGRGFVEPTDDLVALLEHLKLDAVYVIGGSGGGPHVLALAARYPDRVRAATVLVGSAPLVEEEIDGLIGANAESQRLTVTRDLDGLRAHLELLRTAALADPVGSIVAAMEKAPAGDRAIMEEPDWQASYALALQESLRPGVEGWFDETLVLTTGWDAIDLDTIVATITWWHAPGDANAPLSAARRLVSRIQRARLLVWPAEEGHLAPFHRQGEIFDELLARG